MNINRALTPDIAHAVEDDIDFPPASAEEKEMQANRLKAAVLWTVGNLCDEEADARCVTFSREYVAVLAQLAFEHAETIARDLEDFSRHAKRSTIQTDDVLLYARQQPDVQAHLSSLAESIAREKKVASAKRKRLT
eukprot:CFRG2302T1